MALTSQSYQKRPHTHTHVQTKLHTDTYSFTTKFHNLYHFHFKRKWALGRECLVHDWRCWLSSKAVRSSRALTLLQQNQIKAQKWHHLACTGLNLIFFFILFVICKSSTITLNAPTRLPLSLLQHSPLLPGDRNNPLTSSLLQFIGHRGSWWY